MNVAGLAEAAAGEVSAHRLRVALSILSLVIGTASVTAITALGEIGQAAARVQVERETGRAATMEVVGAPLPATRVADLTDDLASSLANHGWTDVSPTIVVSATLGDPPAGGGGATTPLSIVAVTPDLAAIRRLRVVDGRWLAPTDGALYAPVVVVNRVLAAELSGASGAGPLLGAALPVTLDRRVSMRVVGIVDDADREARAYTPWEALRSWLPPVPVQPAWLARVTPGQVAGFTVLVDHLGRQWSVDGMTARRLDSFEDFAPILRTIQLVLSLVAAVALVTGGLGILNLGLVTVRQRAREFALRRAFGAAQRDIVALVLLESAITGFVAGVIGVVLVALLQLLLPVAVGDLLDPADVPPFPIGVAVLGLLLATSVGLLAGLIPALRARDASIIGTIRE